MTSQKAPVFAVEAGGSSTAYDRRRFCRLPEVRIIRRETWEAQSKSFRPAQWGKQVPKQSQLKQD